MSVQSASVTESDAQFAEHHDRIFRHIAAMVRNTAEAEDLTQETFLRAHVRRDSLRDSNAARGWLYRIATHISLDRLRQRRVNVPLEEVTSPLPSALERAEREATSACVQRCLDYLPDNYRGVLLLHKAHGLPAAEIADLLQVSVGSVKIRLHRARRLLEKVMQIGCHVSETDQGIPCCTPKSGTVRSGSSQRHKN